MGQFRRLVVSLLLCTGLILVLTMAILVRRFYRSPHTIEERDRLASSVAPPEAVWPKRAMCLTIPWREAQFEEIRQTLSPQGIALEQLEATVGQYLDVDCLPDSLVSRRVKDQVRKQPSFLGHVGAALTHKESWWRMVQGQWGCTLILEDDAIVPADFATRLREVLSDVQAMTWDVLLLGFSCDEKRCRGCSRNVPRETLGERVVRVRYGVGLWGYLVRDFRSAQKLHDHWPLRWTVDHDFNDIDGLVVLGAIPHLIYHEGTMNTSAWNYSHHEGRPKDRAQYVSHTNL